MKNTLLILASWFISIVNFAQDFEWAKSMGGTSNEKGSSITTDLSGNVYTTGNFYGTADFDPNSGTSNATSNGFTDLFVQKLDDQGNLVWNVTIGSTYYDEGNSIITDPLGNVYVTGIFGATVDFDPGAGVQNITALGGIDAFILKLDAAGNFVWVKSIGGAGFERGQTIDLDQSGNIYLGGTFDGSTDFDPSGATVTFASNGLDDIFIEKLDASGNFIWVKTFGGTGNESVKDLCLDPSGNVYSTGFYNNTVDFDPNAGVLNMTAIGSSDIYVQKLDPSGNLMWSKSFGNFDFDGANSIARDPSGNLYITGYYAGSVNLDPGVTNFTLNSNGAIDAFINKIDLNGNFIWGIGFGGSGATVQANSTVVDNNGFVYTSGKFEYTVDFDPSSSNSDIVAIGGSDVFIQKLNTNGDFQWARAFGGANNDKGNAICLNNTEESVYTTGDFFGGADFDPGTGVFTLTAVSSDIFIQKLEACSGSSSIDIQSVCGSFTWIDGNTYTTSNTTATHILPNIQGCDSIITLNLTINLMPTITVTQNGGTFTADESGASYQWIDCNNSNSPIVGETNQSFTPTINGTYAVIIGNGNCSDTSACIAISDVGFGVNDSQSFDIYPNPTNGIVNIQSPQIIQEITITDINGRMVFKSKPNQEVEVELDLSALETGVYFVELLTADNVIQKQKIVRQ